jgi:hypothetical protein
METQEFVFIAGGDKTGTAIQTIKYELTYWKEILSCPMSKLIFP